MQVEGFKARYEEACEARRLAQIAEFEAKRAWRDASRVASGLQDIASAVCISMFIIAIGFWSVILEAL